MPLNAESEQAGAKREQPLRYLETIGSPATLAMVGELGRREWLQSVRGYSRKVRIVIGLVLMVAGMLFGIFVYSLPLTQQFIIVLSIYFGPAGYILARALLFFTIFPLYPVLVVVVKGIENLMDRLSKDFWRRNGALLSIVVGIAIWSISGELSEEKRRTLFIDSFTVMTSILRKPWIVSCDWHRYFRAEREALELQLLRARKILLVYGEQNERILVGKALLQIGVAISEGRIENLLVALRNLQKIRPNILPPRRRTYWYVLKEYPIIGAILGALMGAIFNVLLGLLVPLP